MAISHCPDPIFSSVNPPPPHSFWKRRKLQKPYPTNRIVVVVAAVQWVTILINKEETQWDFIYNLF